MHIELVGVLRVHVDLVYLVALEFFAHDLKVVLSHKIPVSERHVPHGNSTTRVTNKKSACLVECNTVRVSLVENTSHC